MEELQDFSLEDIQELIRNAEQTVRLVRDSLRQREPSPVPPVPIEVSYRVVEESESIDRETEDSPPSAPSSCNTSGSSDSGEYQRLENSSDSSNMGSTGSINDSVSIIEESASGGALQAAAAPVPTNSCESQDDEVILVSETKNPNPPVIDLCTPDVGGQSGCDPPRGRRRRRKTPPPPDEGSPPQPPQRARHLNCVICMENMTPKRPFSTTCGHVFCEVCIKTAIQVSKRCPICRKILNMKSIHPLYLFTD